ncbi:hypothetical protein H2136_08190 [Aeromonas hydrophila]|uniref:Uncharacterized protein n=1 Tax=Aeromonas hydrophila TaxID=644 RepID=A0A926FHI0_AERHY|nr:hypothetical protein [Aeromonas hydrophila]
MKWSDFKASDADTPATQLSIRITSLPADGLLQYKDAAGKWQTVTQAQVNNGLAFSKGDIDAGKLQFLPDLHESSRLRVTMVAPWQQVWRLCHLRLPG